MNEIWMQIHTEECWPCEDKGTDWSYVATDQGALRIVSSCQKLGEKQGTDPCSEPQ